GLSTGSAVLFLACLCLCQAAPTSTPEVQTLPEDDETVAGVIYIIKPDIHKSLEAMQALFGLEVTGVLDKNTLEVMKESMCGVSDISRYGHFHRKQKWKKSTVTYRITQYTPDPRQSDVDATIAQAFQIYSDVILQDFKQIHTDTADIMILFKDHGDFYPFDDRIDTHFDDDETWTMKVNLQLVAAHEFGHALGLDHPRDWRALMALEMCVLQQAVSFLGYRISTSGVVMECDRVAIVHNWQTPTTVKEVQRFLGFANYYWRFIWGFGQVAAPITSLLKGAGAFAVVSEGAVYRCSHISRILPGYQNSISNLGIPSSVTKLDASVYVPTRGKTLFLVGNKCWSFEARRQMDYGYPRSITQDFPGIGSKVDAVFENLFSYLYFSDGPRQSEYYLAYKRVIGVLLNYG
uniref:Peptidase metallopeptidase domain-containing protein n=1 Tax=Oncorhynchus tshawytscha TaxID=74940 RepID=A0A8C8D9U8_ONCTS